MWELKLIILLASSALFWWGGYNWHDARRFIMPSVLTVSCLLYSGWDWWALTMLSCMGVFCLGYGVKSPLRHCFGDGWGRGVWGLLGGLALSLGLMLSGHLGVGFLWPWLVFLGYLGLNFTLENALKKLPQFIGDPIIGIGFASIIFLVK